MLPAPAGMVPSRSQGRARPPRAPRTRGDGPALEKHFRQPGECSLHPRGWSPSPSPRVRSPASAPRTRGDGPATSGSQDPSTPCSPHPRGWSLSAVSRVNRPGVLPAPAGMVPTKYQLGQLDSRAPRTRGDGPGAGRWCLQLLAHQTQRHRPWWEKGEAPCAPRAAGTGWVGCPNRCPTAVVLSAVDALLKQHDPCRAPLRAAARYAVVRHTAVREGAGLQLLSTTC
ncbi:hypothetical protein C3489_27895 [Streptomyces sp. Ru71]|nr:hypothetical protein C3489_27895 [Streptomyces sp. Ru71]